jgi:hypothetical protein
MRGAPYAALFGFKTPSAIAVLAPANAPDRTLDRVFNKFQHGVETFPTCVIRTWGEHLNELYRAIFDHFGASGQNPVLYIPD